MAVPKRRKSKSRVRTARAGKGLTALKTVACAQCGSVMLSHRVCPTCGFYRKREVVEQQTTTE